MQKGILMKYIPNILTSIRLLLVPIFPIVFFSDNENAKIYATIIYIIAGLTDFLDGFIARRYNLVSKLGTVLDPLADKSMLLIVLYSLSKATILPWWIFVIMLIKESFMIISGIYMYLHKDNIVISSNYFGKTATTLLFIALPIMIIKPTLIISYMMVGIAIIIKVMALITYIAYYLKNHFRK